LSDYVQDWYGPEFIRIQPTVSLFLPDAGVSCHFLTFYYVDSAISVKFGMQVEVDE